MAQRDLASFQQSGLWTGDSAAGGEGAKCRLHVLTELKNRGVGDVLMIV
jgi:hypothetical protein